MDIGISDKDRKEIADGLSHLLADTYTLYLKTHNFHWNVTGPMFNTLHLMFMTQYTELGLAVDLIAETDRRSTVLHDGHAIDQTIEALEERELGANSGGFFAGVRERVSLRRHFRESESGAPGIASTMVEAFNITQDRIARSRLAGDPPDILIGARVGKIGLFDFHRADELITLGRDAVRKALPDLMDHFALATPNAASR